LEEHKLGYDKTKDALTKAKGIVATIKIWNKSKNKIVDFEFVDNVFKFYTNKKKVKDKLDIEKRKIPKNVDTCECGGTLIDIGRDKEDVLMFKCEKCSKIYYNERDL